MLQGTLPHKAQIQTKNIKSCDNALQEANCLLDLQIKLRQNLKAPECVNHMTTAVM